MDSAPYSRWAEARKVNTYHMWRVASDKEQHSNFINEFVT
jgi:hypothetical protein